MLNKDERRFIRYWEEQRTGGKWAYFILYTLGGAIIISLLTYAIIFFAFPLNLGPSLLWWVPGIALPVAAGTTWFNWIRNERRWKRLIRREINDSKKQGNGEKSSQE